MTSTLSERDEYLVDISHTSQNFNERIRYLIFHYTAETNEDSINILTKGETSAHYLVTEKPKYINSKPVALQLLPENLRAWHAGNSHWAGRGNLNDNSIGIEIVNLGYTVTPQGKQYYAYTPEQIDLIIRLSRDIVTRYNIPPDRILGHSDIAPQRKSDPGPKFPWAILAEHGIGAWPDSNTVSRYLNGRTLNQPVPVIQIQNALAKYGYKIPLHGKLDQETKNVIIAFQTHFRAHNISGLPDAETEAIALALIDKYKNQ